MPDTREQVILVTATARIETATPVQADRPPPTPRPTVTPTSTTTLTPAPTRTSNPAQFIWRGDLHIHTTCSDGENSYEEIVQRALELEFDFIAITDHYAFDNEGCLPVVQMCQAETRLLCIPGAEVFVRSPTLPHLLALGIQSNISPASLEAYVEEIHRQGGLAIAAHPSDPLYTDDELYHSGLDAMECARGSQEYDQRQWELSEEYNLPCVYNSDAHTLGDLGRRYTVCTVPINSIADLKAALIGKKCEMNSSTSHHPSIAFEPREAEPLPAPLSTPETHLRQIKE